MLSTETIQIVLSHAFDTYLTQHLYNGDKKLRPKGYTDFRHQHYKLNT